MHTSPKHSYTVTASIYQDLIEVAAILSPPQRPASQRTPKERGPVLTMDSKTECFTGESSAEANMLPTRNYRSLFAQGGSRSGYREFHSEGSGLKKLMDPASRRQTVDAVIEKQGVSQRQACATLGHHRSTQGPGGHSIPCRKVRVGRPSSIWMNRKVHYRPVRLREQRFHVPRWRDPFC